MTDHERRHLAQADQNIAECKSQIARQREIIEELREGGHETDLAQLMLRVLEGNLLAFERQRQGILDRLKDADRR
jgi:hypothetical protein